MRIVGVVVSAEWIDGKRHLVASHNGMKGRDGNRASHSTTEHIRVDGRAALAMQRQVQLYANRAFQASCEMKGFWIFLGSGKRNGRSNIFGISGEREVVVIMSTSFSK